MPNIELLKERIDASGLKMSYISKNTGITRATIYNKLNGRGDFTSNEIVNLSRVLNLNKAEIFEIFLS